MHPHRPPKNSKPSGKEFLTHPTQLPPEKVESLLSQLCSELGFCLSTKVNKRLAYSPPKNPQRFTEVVMQADGLSTWTSELYEQVFSRVHKVFLTELPEDS